MDRKHDKALEKATIKEIGSQVLTPSSINAKIVKNVSYEKDNVVTLTLRKPGPLGK